MKKLTTAEKDVAALLVAGLTNSQIAEKLNISVPTVKRHLTNIYAKLNVSGRIQAAIILFKNRINQ